MDSRLSTEGDLCRDNVFHFHFSEFHSPNVWPITTNSPEGRHHFRDMRHWVVKNENMIAFVFLNFFKPCCNCKWATMWTVWLWKALVSGYIFIILTRVARDWCIYASARTLVGPQRFISGSVVLSPNRRFASPSRRAADSQNVWHLSNTDAPVYVHRWAISSAPRWRSSEREKKLSNWLAAPSFFQNFWPVNLRSPTDLSHYPDQSLIEAMCTLRIACQVNNRTDGPWWIARFPQSARFKHETHTHTTWTEVGERTGSPTRPNELRTSKTFGALKVRSLFHRSTRPSSGHA